MTKEEIEAKMDEEVEEIDVKEWLKEFRKKHPVKFWTITIGMIATGTAAIAGIGYLLYKKFGPKKDTDEEDESEEDLYEDKTDEESETEEN